MTEEIVKYCPVCKTEKKFLKIVEAHITYPMPAIPVIGSPAPPPYVVTTEHPTAYCSECRVVIFIGPSDEDVERDFERKKQK